MNNFVGIVAFCKNNGIGKNNTIPWDIKDDILFFKIKERK